MIRTEHARAHAGIALRRRGDICTYATVWHAPPPPPTTMLSVRTLRTHAPLRIFFARMYVHVVAGAGQSHPRVRRWVPATHLEGRHSRAQPRFRERVGRTVLLHEV